MENINAGLNHNLENKAATYESDVTIKDVISFDVYRREILGCL